MIEPLKHILDIYDKKKDTLLYYLTDDVKEMLSVMYESLYGRKVTKEQFSTLIDVFDKL